MVSIPSICTFHLVVIIILFQNIEASEYIDLTYPFNNETVLFPGLNISFYIETEGFTPGGYWEASKGFCLSEHTGTHIDAPYHFHKYGKTLDQLPLKDLIDVPGVMIDIYDKVHKHVNGKLIVIENYALTREDIIEWEKINGQIPRRALVLLRSGWGSRWPNKNLYRGVKPDTSSVPSGAPLTLNSSNVQLNFPGYDASAAQFLSTKRQIVGVGIDTLSIDIGSTMTFPSHVIFAAKGIYMIENVANLGLLPPKGFRLFAAPFKVDRGTGAPIRLLARLNKG